MSTIINLINFFVMITFFELVRYEGLSSSEKRIFIGACFFALVALLIETLEMMSKEG